MLLLYFGQINDDDDDDDDDYPRPLPISGATRIQFLEWATGRDIPMAFPDNCVECACGTS